MKMFWWNKNCRVLEFSPSKSRHTCTQYSGLIVAKSVHKMPKINVNCNCLYSLQIYNDYEWFRAHIFGAGLSCGVEKNQWDANRIWECEKWKVKLVVNVKRHDGKRNVETIVVENYIIISHFSCQLLKKGVS